MGGMRISELDFIRLLPAFMRDDEAAIALSKAMNKLLREPFKRIDTIRTWDKIDELTEPECDELAWELDVDWYDSGGMSLEEKRNTLKLAQQIKRKRGTKWAVEQLISAYFGEGYVMEWYEMYGTPYTFAALTTNEHTDAASFEKFMEAVRAAKNVRSHIAGVFYFWQQGPDPGVEYALGSKMYRYNFRKCGTYPRRATVGFLIKPSIETEPEVKLYLYGFTKPGQFACGTYPRPGTLGAAVKEGVAVNAEDEGIRYKFKRKAGTYPRPGTLGQAIKQAVAAGPETEPTRYGFTKAGQLPCGTYPRPGALGQVLQSKIEAGAAALFLPYAFTKAGPGTCGTYPAKATLGVTCKNMAAAAPEAVLLAYAFVKCGTRRCGQ